MPDRTARIGDHVRECLARAIREDLRDPRVGFVTLTDVKLSTDLRNAVVFVTVLGDDPPEAALDTLNHATPFFRRVLAREAGLRFTPRLRFVYDETVEGGRRMEDLLDTLRRERGDPREAGIDPEPDTEES